MFSSRGLRHEEIPLISELYLCYLIFNSLVNVKEFMMHMVGVNFLKYIFCDSYDGKL